MEAQRRKDLEKIIGKLEEASAELEAVREQEQEAFDNFPENLQYSEKGERMEEAISYMDDAIGNIEDTISNIQEAIV